MSEESKSKEPESKQSQLLEELQDKPTRDAFVSSQMSIPLAFQILALREQRGMTQKQLAEKAGMLQPRIAAMERPSGSEPNLRTLKRLASAFDVALIVRFAPFSELVEWTERFSPDTFIVPSFDEDLDLEKVTSGIEADPTQHNPFQEATGLLAELRTDLHHDAMQLVLPKNVFVFPSQPHQNDNLSNLPGMGEQIVRDHTPEISPRRAVGGIR